MRITLVYSTYERHYSHILEKSEELLRRVADQHGAKADAGHLRLCRHGHGGERAASLRAGGVRHPRGGQARWPPRRTCIIELGGEDAKILFLDRRHGGADERHLRRRHRRLHRPDGHPAERGPADEMDDACAASREDLHHRLPLRRVRQDRHPAPHQPGCQGRRILPPASIRRW